MSILIRFMASSMTRRRNPTTRPRPSRHGHAPLTGSTSTCATDWDNPIGVGVVSEAVPDSVMASGPPPWRDLAGGYPPPSFATADHHRPAGPTPHRGFRIIVRRDDACAPSPRTQE